MKTKKIIITGVAGLLGANLSRYLIDKGFTVIGVDDLSGGYEESLPQSPNFFFYKESLGLESSSRAFSDHKDASCVFHFAAYAAEGLSPFIRRYNYQNNVLASVDVINQCVNNDIKLIFTSSMAVYGGGNPPFTENLRPDPVDPYGIAKYAIEMDIKQASSQFGLRYNIVRPHNVLGIYQNIWDRYRNVIGIFIRRSLNGLPLLVYGDGEQVRAFSDIKFYMSPFFQLIDGHDGETYNIGADKYYTIKEVALKTQAIAKEFGFDTQIENKEKRHEVKCAYCDHEKAKKDLGFQDETDLDSLIREMFLWGKSLKQKEIKNMNYEIEKGLYSYWK